MEKLSVTRCNIDGLLIIEPNVHFDARGYFMETYNERDFKEAGIHCHFVQDNQSKSSKGILRGLHYQHAHPQEKLVRALVGEVFVAVVDLRTASPTYGQSFGIHLSEENKKQLFVPKGFAHGYLVLSETAVFSYKCGDFYTPGDEYGILWNDPALNIAWPSLNNFTPQPNERDSSWPTLAKAKENGWIF